MTSSLEEFDAVVVGAGPGGSAAALKCAQNGLKTLILEKRSLPRDKVCSGMVMGQTAKQIITEEFEGIPSELLADPGHLKGHMIHVPGAQERVIACATPLAWRKDLDSWLCRGAQKEGVEIRDRTRVMKISHDDRRGVSLAIRDKGGLKELRARFLIGADGATSVVRRSIFARLKVPYSSPVRECYRGSLDLDRHYCHWFFPRRAPRPRFEVHHKDGFFLIEGSGIRDLRQDILLTLSNYGFRRETQPLWRDGCAVALLHGQMMEGIFSPARGNTLLVGDAAGLILPITFEGIGTALKSGLMAGRAVAQANKRGREAGEIYLGMLRPLISVIGSFYRLQEKLSTAPAKGASPLADALKGAYQETLKAI